MLFTHHIIGNRLLEIAIYEVYMVAQQDILFNEIKNEQSIYVLFSFFTLNLIKNLNHLSTKNDRILGFDYVKVATRQNITVKKKVLSSRKFFNDRKEILIVEVGITMHNDNENRVEEMMHIKKLVESSNGNIKEESKNHINNN
ncbi:hypothetical protein NAPIS_ORF01694 [Vairimorpha apis BRL 01]|uniref:Uncharacterized protein n=1 Tax=Vairimorpha apis BRL 01 TaxID=1037528 RepID=T0L8C0_9MICR|nr:hypothetical protein NAPIS_ORF01694 [Vairimorpha apis BRL 01]